MPEESNDQPREYQLTPNDTRHIGGVPDHARDHESVIDPKSPAGSYLPQTKDSSDHAYTGKDTLNDGTVIYYYDNGVKSIHHPDPAKATVKYHANARDVHQDQARKFSIIDRGAAQSHMAAATGHSMAIQAKSNRPKPRQTTVEPLYKPDLPAPKPKEEAPKVGPSAPRTPPRRTAGAGPVRMDQEKLKKSALEQFSDYATVLKDGGAVDGVGTVAVASDPGVFTPTYGARGPVKKKNKKSGVAKLDMFLRNGPVQTFAVNLVKEAREELNLQDAENYDSIEKSNAFVAGFDSTVPMRDTRPHLPKKAVKVKSDGDEPAEEERANKLVKEEKETTQQAFYELFKEYFDGLDSAEDDNDSRDSQEGYNTTATGGSNVD